MSPAAKTPWRLVCIMLSTLICDPSISRPHSFIGPSVLLNPTFTSTASISIRRSEEHTSELQSLMRISYAVFCLQKKKKKETKRQTLNTSSHPDKTTLTINKTSVQTTWYQIQLTTRHIPETRSRITVLLVIIYNQRT